ncbi:MAG TPA: response regulator transcription factor [Ktedonobacterales bacterium]|jgi:DNA-binding response OmpR family regulator|nr:response regulator transcription factor [Ktedonobacterales bacterium]
MPNGADTTATHDDAARQDRRILVVDDEEPIREVLAQYLRRAGYSVLEAADGVEALRIASATPPDLLILDLMLPGMDGLEVCRKLRETLAAPILMLTARGEEEDTLEGFRAGADDYVTKPFSPREVVMRAQAIMRRVEATSAPAIALDDVLIFGELAIKPHLRQAERAGVSLDLTAREFDLLRFLASHPRQVFSRQQLLDQIWGYDYFGDASTVTVHIRRLREKVERDPAEPTRLKTVWGVGYKFEP